MDENWEPVVLTRTIFVTFGSQYFRFSVGGPTPQGEEYWGTVYFLAIPGDATVPSAPAVTRMLKLLKQGARGLSALGTGYNLSSRVGNGPYQNDTVMPQILFSPASPDQVPDSPSFFEQFGDEWNRGFGAIEDGSSPFR